MAVDTVTLKTLAKNLASTISQSNDNKISAASKETLSEVKNKVVADAIKENLSVSNINDLTTDEELASTLKDYVKKEDIFKNGFFYTKYTATDGSHALLWNESDGGGSQYRNKAADLLSYVGTNDGGENGICVQIYSKSETGSNHKEEEIEDGVTQISGLAKNEGVRINVNPHGAYYTKGTDTSATGGSVNNEIAVKGDVKKVQTTLNNKVSELNALKAQVSTLETLVASLQTALSKVKDSEGNPIYTVPSDHVDDEL